MSLATIQITGGSFQDADGTVLANGYLTLELSQDAKVSDSNTSVCAGVKITVPLNANGSITNTSNNKYYAWPNDSLLPINTFYTVTGFTAAGQVAWGPNTQQILGTTVFDVGVWVPGQLTWWTPPLIPLTIEVNGVMGDQTMLNLVEGDHITITDNGLGTVTIAAAWPTTPYDLGVAFTGAPIANESVRYQFPRAVTFSANFAGSYAACAVAATADTVFTIKKNGSSVGTVTFSAAGTTGVFSTTGAVSFVAGDLFELVAPGTPDATWSDGDFSLAGVRS